MKEIEAGGKATKGMQQKSTEGRRSRRVEMKSTAGQIQPLPACKQSTEPGMSE